MTKRDSMTDFAECDECDFAGCSGRSDFACFSGGTGGKIAPGGDLIA
jgi:hypothetical protein